MNVAKPLRPASLVLCGLAVFATGCRPLPSLTGSQTKAAEIETLRRVDADWVKAAQTHQIDAWLSFYAPDAVVLPPNAKTADTPAAIRASVAQLLTLKDLNLDWKPTRIVMDDAQQIAWLYGTYALIARDNSGLPIADNGKIAEIWQKQPDGAWKCVLDTWNSDLPVLQPEPEKK